MNYYDKTEATCTVSVLGTEYSVYMDVPEDDDEMFRDCDGYCDKTSHRIAICAKTTESNLDDDEQYRKQILRHEIIHAFLFESGLGGDAVWHVAGQEHPEQTVDWMARQFPKMLKAFEQAGAL